MQQHICVVCLKSEWWSLSQNALYSMPLLPLSNHFPQLQASPHCAFSLEPDSISPSSPSYTMYWCHVYTSFLGCCVGKKYSLPFPVFFLYSHAAMGFPGGSDVKESACSAGDLSSFPGLGRSGEGKGYPLQYSGLEDSMDCRVQGVVKSRTQLSNFHSPRFRCQS